MIAQILHEISIVINFFVATAQFWSALLFSGNFWQEVF